MPAVPAKGTWARSHLRARVRRFGRRSVAGMGKTAGNFSAATRQAQLLLRQSSIDECFFDVHRLRPEQELVATNFVVVSADAVAGILAIGRDAKGLSLGCQ